MDGTTVCTGLWNVRHRRDVRDLTPYRHTRPRGAFLCNDTVTQGIKITIKVSIKRPESPAKRGEVCYNGEKKG